MSRKATQRVQGTRAAMRMRQLAHDAGRKRKQGRGSANGLAAELGGWELPLRPQLRIAASMRRSAPFLCMRRIEPTKNGSHTSLSVWRHSQRRSAMLGLVVNLSYLFVHHCVNSLCQLFKIFRASGMIPTCAFHLLIRRVPHVVQARAATMPRSR